MAAAHPARGPGSTGARGQPIDGNAGHCNPRRTHHAARYEKREGGLLVVLPLFQSPPSFADGGVFLSLSGRFPAALPCSSVRAGEKKRPRGRERLLAIGKKALPALVEHRLS